MASSTRALKKERERESIATGGERGSPFSLGRSLPRLQHFTVPTGPVESDLKKPPPNLFHTFFSEYKGPHTQTQTQTPSQAPSS